MEGIELSGIGRKYESEMTTYIDKKSGREVTRLTCTGENHHFYFTDNSFTLGDEEIIYLHSDHPLGDSRHRVNLFRMDLNTGEREQLTDFESQFKRVDGFSKSRDSRIFVFVADGNLYRMDRQTGEHTLLYTAPAGFALGHPSVSFDNRYAAIAANEIVPRDAVARGENYAGFAESFFTQKLGYIVIARMDGSGGEIVFEDTHWLGHVQFAPDTNEFLSYCHEGPWNYVQQRIWVLNTLTRHVKPCFRQGRDDSVGHEFWTRDGLIFFDNRGRGHDGTITSDQTQAVVVSEDGPDAIPWIGFADKECNILRRIELPYYCNHYHANLDHTRLVADAVSDIMLIDLEGGVPSIEVLCEHHTSWRWQWVHCHPCWSWSNDKIIFASDCDAEGYPQIYMVKMK